MNETPDYMALVDLISELDNMEMMRITGISLLMESNNTVDIIHALCGVNETPVVESADRWVAYV